ncbi:MAG: hypothetical protein GC131_06305 [Alphaproteobacteria bacterium]|nr:hypothetical protein [Alphaproteobacteria bacterium]
MATMQGTYGPRPGAPAKTQPVKPFVYKPKVTREEKIAMWATRGAMVMVWAALLVALMLIISANKPQPQIECRSSMSGFGGSSLIAFGGCSVRR